MKNTALSINLVKKTRETALDKFIQWALSIGRVVVILTEAIALSAFLYRFVLDRQLIDLRDHIKQNQAIVHFSQKNEETYRNLQDRLSLAKKLQKTTENTMTIFTTVLDHQPEDFIITSISLNATRLTIEASASTIASFTTYVNTLKEYPFITSVSLDKIEAKATNSTISVNISATLKQEGPAILPGKPK